MATDGPDGNGHLPMHELATLFPAMSDEEYTGLKADIEMNGVHQAVAVWQGQIIDGRHRYQACNDLGIKPPLRYLPDDVDPLSFVLSANMSRRQLTPSQKVIITAQLPRLVHGSNRYHLESKGIKVESDAVLYSRHQRATIAGVDVTYQDRADGIVDHGDTDVIARVRNGEISVRDAYLAVRAAKKAKEQADREAKRAMIARQEAVRAAAAAERATAEREAAEARVRVEQAAAEREKAEREAAERARVEREAVEARISAERAAEAAAEREAAERSRAEHEAEILAAAKDRLANDPDITLPKAVKEQRRREALRVVQEQGVQNPYDNESSDIDLSNAVPVGRHSRVVFIDSLDPDNGLAALPDEVAALTFTSPPYWTFAEYGDVGVGYEESYEGYIDSLRRVFTVAWQKTMPGGRVVVNISNMKSKQAEDGAAFVYPIVPDLVRAMTSIGFTFFDEIIWAKRDTTTRPMSGSPLWGSYPYPPTPKILDSTFENILVFCKPGRRDVELGVKEQSRLTMEEWREYTKGIWRVESGSTPNHPATFPMEVADRVIRMYSFVNDVVLDPFAGTGTTIVSAEANGRAGVGYEISKAYRKPVRDKATHCLEELLT